MTRLNRSRGLLAAIIFLGITALTGCSSLPALTVDQMPLPAPGSYGATYTIHGSFTNVLNLPAKAKVKLDGATVGEVTEISVSDYRAHVTMKVSKSVTLPVGSWAELRQATPLGDVFVALDTPAGDAANRGSLRNGDNLQDQCPPASQPQNCNQAAATVEDVMTTAAAFLNGGLFSNAQNVIKELDIGLSGHETDISGILQGAQTALNRLRQNTTEINGSVNQVSRLANLIAASRGSIAGAINALGPALNTIDSQIGTIVSLVNQVQPLTAAGKDYLNTSSGALRDGITQIDTLVTALNQSTGYLTPITNRVKALQPMIQKTLAGNSLAADIGLMYLTPGWPLESGSRLPEVSDIPEGASSLYQTLVRLFARLTGTHGCCGD